MDIMELRLEALKLARDAFGGNHTPADLLVSEASKFMEFVVGHRAPLDTSPGREYLKKKGA